MTGTLLDKESPVSVPTPLPASARSFRRGNNARGD